MTLHNVDKAKYLGIVLENKLKVTLITSGLNFQDLQPNLINPNLAILLLHTGQLVLLCIVLCTTLYSIIIDEPKNSAIEA